MMKHLASMLRPLAAEPGKAGLSMLSRETVMMQMILDELRKLNTQILQMRLAQISIATGKELEGIAHAVGHERLGDPDYVLRARLLHALREQPAEEE